MTRLDSLTGARIRRVDVPHDDLVAVSLTRPGGQREVLLMGIGEPPGMGLVDGRPRGAPARGFARTLRRTLGNALVDGLVEIDDEGARLWGRQGPRARALIWDRRSRDVVLLEDGHSVRASLVPAHLAARSLERGDPHPLADAAGRAPDLEALRAAGPRLLASRKETALQWRRAGLAKDLSRARKRLDRKCRAIEGDRDRALQAPDLRHEASLLVAHLHAIAPGARSVTVTDWNTEPPAERSLPIDPRLGAKAQADALFHRARRLERGARIAAERLARTAEQRDAIRDLQDRLEQAQTPEEVEAIARDAAEVGVAGASLSGEGAPRSGSGDTAPRLPYRSFEGTGGRPVLVGRGAADNDALTLHHARPQDLWLHARDRRGAHVIVPLAKNESCPPDLLVDAATLAAHFSEARGEPVVEVQYTPRRHVRKPKKSPPGSVRVHREKVIAVRIEPGRLERLLGSK